ncbi:MAG: HAMP domain-containing histidine kinase, partial [Acetobacteraceae bacterium]|nr:HAMP domain-containing histidine kinase [Acetobacteraceae bacterium]
MALLLMFLAMAAIHTVLLARTVDKATEEILARQLSSLMDSIAAAPEWDRDAIAHGLSRPDLEVHWLPANVPDPWGTEHVRWVPLSDRIRALSRFSTAVRIRPGTIDADQQRVLGVAAIADFPDGSHLLVRMSSVNLLAVDTAALYSFAAGAALFVLGAAALALRSATAPLTALSTAVQGLSVEAELPAVDDHAPEEVRTLARRLDDMADRVRTALRQRTLALAALSHDIMSPVSRLKLRAVEMPDSDQRHAIQRDLDEIETMVTDVLVFLRGGHESEPARMLHVPSIIQTLVDEFASAGQAVEELRIDDVIVEGRPTALKRAIRNLISNAVIHGRAPWIAAEIRGPGLAIRVGDNGPGIPADDLPLVMTPFFRGDRARATGG